MLTEIKVTEEFIEQMDKYREKPEGKSLFEACSDNIVLFAEHMLGLKLYAWQVDFLSRITYPDRVKRIFLALTSRQIGKSTAVAILAVWSAVFNKFPGTIHNNTVIGISSASDGQAKKLLLEIKKIMMSGDRFMERTYKDEVGQPRWKKFFSKLLSNTEKGVKAADKGSNNTTTITFRPYNVSTDGLLLKDSHSGSIIKSYPPTAVVLGETFTVIVVDEAGFTDRVSDTFYYDYLVPTGSSTNALQILLSTPWSPTGFFYEYANPLGEFKDDDRVEKVLYTTDAIRIENPKQYETNMTDINKLVLSGKKDEADRAYFCKFVKGERNYFNPDDVRACFKDSIDMVDSFSGECDLGVDFGGQVSSRTVLTVSTLTPDGFIRRLWHKSYAVGQDNDLLNDIQYEVLPFFNIQRIIPDNCPQGDYLIRQMIEKGWNVYPMSFRSDKVKKYGAFRSMLKKRNVESYIDDDLQKEMIGLEFSQGSRQSLIQHSVGYSDDLIDSFVMSAYFYIENDSDVKLFTWDDV